MSKGLEALKEIKKCLFWSDEGLKNIATIEKELKVSEIIKHFIKSKPLGLKFIFLDDDKKILIIDNDEFECWYNCEIQEEYDLLKEALKDE